MNRRFDTMQAENQRQHDAMQEVLRVFEGRMMRLEEKAGINPENAEWARGSPLACSEISDLWHPAGRSGNLRRQIAQGQQRPGFAVTAEFTCGVLWGVGNSNCMGTAKT